MTCTIVPGKATEGWVMPEVYTGKMLIPGGKRLSVRVRVEEADSGSVCA